MKFSVQPSVSKRIWKILNFLYFLIDNVIHDVVYLMNLGNECGVTDFIICFKKLCFCNNLMFPPLIKLETSKTNKIFLLSKFLHSIQ